MSKRLAWIGLSLLSSVLTACVISKEGSVAPGQTASPGGAGTDGGSTGNPVGAGGTTTTGGGTRTGGAPTPPAAPNRITTLGKNLLMGVFENPGGTWTKSSGAAWNARYAYFVHGWENNFNYGARDGSFAANYMTECDGLGTVPAIAYYVMNGYTPTPADGNKEALFYHETQDPTTMNGYFSDWLLMMQVAKKFGKPVLFLIEADGYGFLEGQTADNSGAYAAIADSGLAELRGVPNTVAGWGLAFLAIRQAVGADNAILGIHLSGWASGNDVLYSGASDDLQPQVDKVYTFLAPLGLAANATNDTYDFIVTDPLDRDSDYYNLVYGDPNRWWDTRDTAAIGSRSFVRYHEYLRLWQAKAGKKFVIWQIPLGNSNHLNVNNDGSPRAGYKDNRAEYFLGTGNSAHIKSFTDVGVIALLFGAGAGGVSSYGNDIYTDGLSFIGHHADLFFKAGGATLP